MSRRFFLVFLIFPSVLFAQYTFQGNVDKNQWKGKVYLSIIDDYRKTSGVFQEQIIKIAVPNPSGVFTFKGNNLLANNRLYRIHVDACSDDEINENHFTGHCPNSKEIVFIANNTDALYLPLSNEDEMFCEVISKNEKANTIIKIDSVFEEMKYDFASYRSEANRKLNSKKWFSNLQEYGEKRDEPLAELYIYSFLSNRSNDLYTYYLKNLETNTYYDDLQKRLVAKYPETSYTKQYISEIASDKFLISPKQKTKLPSWVYFISALLLASIIYNIFLLKKVKKTKNTKKERENLLSSQEKKVLDLILKDKTNKEIADTIFVSLSTVKTHINNLYKKLEVSSRDEVKSKYK